MKTTGILLTKIFLAGLIMFGFVACVSVNLTPKMSKSDDVKFDAPGSGFEKIKSQGADAAWQDKKLGNSISFLSSCNDPADPPLEIIEKDMLASFDTVKVLNTSLAFFDGRESRKSQAQGSIDGIQTTVEILTFKKNNCIYSISYVAVSKNFNVDLSVFHTFLESFKAP